MWWEPCGDDFHRRRRYAEGSGAAEGYGGMTRLHRVCSGRMAQLRTRESNGCKTIPARNRMMQIPLDGNVPMRIARPIPGLLITGTLMACSSLSEPPQPRSVDAALNAGAGVGISTNGGG